MAPVPESVLKKRKRADDWAAKRADAAAQKQLKAKSNRREVFKRAETYAKEYRSQVGRVAALGRLCWAVYRLTPAQQSNRQTGTHTMAIVMGLLLGSGDFRQTRPQPTVAIS